MKITIKSESNLSYKRTVSVQCNDFVDMEELAEVFAGACVACGFRSEEVKKYVYSEMLSGQFKGDKEKLKHTPKKRK